MPGKKRGLNPAGLAQRSVGDFFDKSQAPNLPTECSGKRGRVGPAGRNRNAPTEQTELQQVLVSEGPTSTAAKGRDEGKAKIDPVPQGHALERGAYHTEVMPEAQTNSIATDQGREQALAEAPPEGGRAVPLDAQRQPRSLARNVSRQGDLLPALPEAQDDPDDLSDALADNRADELAMALDAGHPDDSCGPASGSAEAECPKAGGVLLARRADEPKGVASGSAQAKWPKGGGVPGGPGAHPPGDGLGHPAEDEPEEHSGGVAVAEQDPGPPVVPSYNASVGQRQCPVQPLRCSGGCGKQAHNLGSVVSHMPHMTHMASAVSTQQPHMEAEVRRQPLRRRLEIELVHGKCTVYKVGL